jgi:hypothetical protein
LKKALKKSPPISHVIAEEHHEVVHNRGELLTAS